MKNPLFPYDCLNGIPPDYEVEYTQDDVVQKRDPLIEKALEIIAK